MAASPVLRVTLAKGPIAEQTYVLDVLLREFLGLTYEVGSPASGNEVVIEFAGRRARLPQSLLSGCDDLALARGYLAPSVVTMKACEVNLPMSLFGAPTVPILYGTANEHGKWITKTPDEWVVHADLLGSSFFFLTRLEEAESGQEDEFGLFPASASLAFVHGFLNRPIVDEYMEILWGVLHALWPGLKRRQSVFGINVSHDVDRPFAYDHSRFRDRVWAVRSHAKAGTLPPLLGSRRLNGAAASLGLPHHDPFENFDWLMTTDEQYGHSATYYFLCGGEAMLDARYDIDSPRMRALLRRVADRGHEIGIHGSYDTMDDAKLLASQIKRLSAALAKEGLSGQVVSGRQHYLRWRVPVTWCVAESVGLQFDSSVGFNQAIGFRAGTSFEYPVFDIDSRRVMPLRERPLHLMDRALAGLDQETALAQINGLRTEVRRHGGTLGVLWHNNIFLESPLELERYMSAIAGET